MSWWVTIVTNAAHNVAQLFKNKEDRNYKTITSNGNPEDFAAKYKNMPNGVPDGMYIGVDNIGYQIAPVKQTYASLQKKSERFGSSVDIAKFQKSGKDQDGNDLYILKLEYRVQPKFPEDLKKMSAYYPSVSTRNIIPFSFQSDEILLDGGELDSVQVVASKIQKPPNPWDSDVFTMVIAGVLVVIVGINYFRS